MQNDEIVGRVLLASLHQAIREVLPARLEFYESWLKPSGLRRRTIQVASFTAVISGLRHEGDAYDLVTARAGQYAALWSFEELFAVKRAFLRALPHRLRLRKASRLIGRMLHNLYVESDAHLTWRGSTIFIDLHGSPFCVAPALSNHPLCGFYASAIATLLRLLNLQAAVRVSRCTASGAKSCLLLVLTDNVRTAPHTSTLGLSDTESVEPILEPLVPSSPAGDLQPSIEVKEAVPEGLEPAPEAAAPAAQSQPETVETTELDRIQIEMQWARIVSGARGAATGKKVPRATVTPPPTATEGDPEAPWRRL